MSMTDTRPPAADAGPGGLRRILRMYGRAARLRCPHCGLGSIRGSWLKMRRACPACGLRTERGEEDFFLGAMMFNIVLAEGLLVLAILAFVLLRWPAVPWDALTWTGLGLMAAAPFLFYPFSHTIWLASDLVIRPITAAELEWHRTHPPDAYRRQRDR